jgi:uncharacterized integral membrane protein
MQFLKILFWCLLAFLAAAFTIGNWNAVPIRLPGGLVADINLPFLLLVTFLLGLLPTLGWQAAKRWRLRQRIATCERQLAEMRVPAATTTPVRSPAPPLLP